MNVVLKIEDRPAGVVTGDDEQFASILSQDEKARYARHLTLPQVGDSGQRRLKDASVFCVGAGGLGSPALLYLAAAGIGKITIIDDDAIERSNLQRQILHADASVGESKATSAASRLAELNPEVEVTTHGERLTSANALELLRGHDVVIDGTDNIPTRYLINDACEILGIPWVYGSIFRFEGQVTVFNHDGGPTYRDLFPSPPPPEAIPSCEEGGVLGILPGVIGSIQATEALKIILGLGDLLSGRLLVYDALEMSFRDLTFVATAGREPVTELIDYEGFCAGSAAEGSLAALGSKAEGAFLFGEIGPAEYLKRKEQGWNPVLLDVRNDIEADIVTLPDTEGLIPHEQILIAAASLPRDRDIVFYCRTGGRSAAAAWALGQSGFEWKRLWNLAGGIHAWSEQVDSAVPKY